MNNDAAWTAEMTEALKAEVEKRFSDRTPPTRIDEMLPETRVTNGEIRTWTMQQFGMMPPLDPVWLQSLADWYVAMAKRVMRQKGEKNPHTRRMGKGLRYEK